MLKTLIDDLWRTEAEYPFGNEVQTGAFLWESRYGNVVIYNSRKLNDELAWLKEKGGVKSILLCHRDEAYSNVEELKRELGARVYCPSEELREVVNRARVSAQQFNTMEADKNLQLIATPGHSPGSTCILARVGGSRILFSSDTLFLIDGVVSVAPEEGAYEVLKRSIMKVVKYKFDYLMPGLWIGEQYYRMNDDDGLTIGREAVASLEARR